MVSSPGSAPTTAPSRPRTRSGRWCFRSMFGCRSAALSGPAGAAVGAVSTFSPADAGRFTLFSFVAAVLGGLGNTSGALLGGLLLGLFQEWGGQLLPGTLVNAVAFGVLVVVLAVRPQGLAGRAFYASRVE